MRRLFEPLGYTVSAKPHVLDEQFPDWGDSAYFSVELSHTITLHDLLTHLYVLIPVLDNDKHYWIGEDEVQKLLRHGESWLAQHPEKEQIVTRYLKHQKSLAQQALAQLLDEDQKNVDEVEARHGKEEEQVEEKISLNEQRLSAVIDALKISSASRVLDLGCSNGNLLRRLMGEKQFTDIVGLDVSHRALQISSERLHFDRMPEKQRQRIKLIQGSLGYRDKRIAGYDAAAVVEVIEHLDEPRLIAFERVLFEFAKPKTVIVTTPNVEYNVKFETLPAGKFRHKDHRFEWTRQQFQSWATRIAERFAYAVRFQDIGPVDEIVGSPTQMAVFTIPLATETIS
jgi:3' terminal RNA ribose 2'-O-methyltransferase Hen1